MSVLKPIFYRTIKACLLFTSCTPFLLRAQMTISGPQISGAQVLQGYNLAALKRNYAAGVDVAMRQVGDIVSLADKYLHSKPVSVMDKGIVPPSGSKHDYMSQAPYFWYDSSKPNGLPYLRRDGERNPEINKITDRKNIGDLENATTILALAWYFTGKEPYAAKGSLLLRTWFLDAGTKMNPNLDYGQGIPGINTGRGIGIIETIALIGIADAATLLSNSSAWTKEDHTALQQWYAEYLQWLQTSANGKEEHAAKNNHGTWYYTQAVAFALFAGDDQTAKKLAEESKHLMEGQFDSDGKQPLELERTNALWYSTYNLQAWVRLAPLAQKTGVDVWQYRNSGGAGILKAIEWLAPYASEKQHFPYQQIDKYSKYVFSGLTNQAMNDYANTHPALMENKKVTDTLFRLMTESL
jgi:hypothetical protein